LLFLFGGTCPTHFQVTRRTYTSALMPGVLACRGYHLPQATLPPTFASSPFREQPHLSIGTQVTFPPKGQGSCPLPGMSARRRLGPRPGRARSPPSSASSAAISPPPRPFPPPSFLRKAKRKAELD
jgi:hypothetical protein